MVFQISNGCQVKIFSRLNPCWVLNCCKVIIINIEAVLGCYSDCVGFLFILYLFAV